MHLRTRVIEATVPESELCWRERAEHRDLNLGALLVRS